MSASFPNSNPKHNSIHEKALLNEVMPKLRPFQREALEFATEGRIFERQFHYGATDEHERLRSCNKTLSSSSRIHPQGRLLLADEMGLGKTVTALAIASYYESEWPLLILCPASLRYTWPSELEKFFPSTLKHQSVHVVAGFSDVTFLQRNDIKVVVCTYSLFQKRSAVAHALADRPFQVVICDESHNLKEKNSQRAEFLLPLLQKTKRLLLLSGTPALAKPVELWTQVHALRADLFGNHSLYTKKFCNPQKKRIGRGRFIWDYGGSSNEEELHTKLRQVMVRRLKADVLAELPPKQRTVIPVTITASEKETCKSKMKELKASRGSSIEEALEQQPGGFNNDSKSGTGFHSAIMQAYQATGMGKAQAVVDYLMDFLAGSDAQKILVFAHHKKVMDHIDAALCRKHPNTHIRIDGSVPAAVRTQLVRQFQSNSRVRVGLLSMTAAGVGLTLTMASTVLFAELHWTPGVLAQAEDRAHRIGSTASCIQIIYMVCRDEDLSLDPMLWRMLGKKIGTLGQIVDGKKERPYLHVAMEQQAMQQPRSVQEEVSDFFAMEQEVDKLTRKTPVKGSIESFFKPRSSKEPRSVNSVFKTPFASKSSATPKVTNDGNYTKSWECSVSEVENIMDCVSCQRIPCVCGNLHNSVSKTTITGEAKQVLLQDHQAEATSPKIGFVEWACERCTFLNKKACNSASFYHCKMCSCSYSPEFSSMTTPGQTTSSLSGTPQFRRISIGTDFSLHQKRREFSPSESVPVEINEYGPQATTRPTTAYAPKPQIIEISDGGTPEGFAKLNNKGSESDGYVSETRINLLEFRVSANSGRVSIFYASNKESAGINFDVSDVVTPETSDMILKSTIQRGSGDRFHAADVLFSDSNVRKVVNQLKGADKPGMKRRYGKDLREFVASYIVLGESEKKGIKDSDESFPPGNLGHAAMRKSKNSKNFERYIGGAKERAYQSRGQGTASVREEAVLRGEACSWCGLAFSKAQKKAGATYCSQRCAEEGRIKRGGQFASSNIRSAMFSIEGGVCTICGIAAHQLFKQIKALQPAERLNKLLQAGWKLPRSGKAMKNLLNDPKEGDFWQVDHIEAVAEGGGGCDIENLRTLCVPCHQGETQKLHARLKLASPTRTSYPEVSGGTGKKRKQLDIRQSFSSGSKRKPSHTS